MGARAWGVTVFAGALAATGGHGCVDDGVSAHVICAVPPNVTDNGCTWEPDGTECLLDGVLNLLATDHYSQVLRVESGLKARVREVPPQGETSRINFDRAVVELLSAKGERFKFEDDVVGGATVPVPNPYTVTATGFVAPNEVGQTAATLITPSYARQLNKLFAGDSPPSSAQIVLSVKLKGKTDGDTAVSTGEFLWPVRLIRASVNPTDPASNCSTASYCVSNFGQDAFANVCAPQ